MEIINQLEQEFSVITKIKEKIIQPKKIQLHSNIDGFTSDNVFGIYKHTGGKPLGIVSNVFHPQDPILFVDNVVHAIYSCNAGYDLNSLQYHEYAEGKKISISVESNPFEVDSPVLGDVFKTKIHFITGFDGKTKTSLTFSTLRLKCKNGAKSWVKEIILAFKNTLGNVNKTLLLCNDVFKVDTQIKDYHAFLNTLATKQYDPVDKAYLLNTLLEIDETKAISPRKQNILDAINQSVGIEEAELGRSYYALLQGITRYTTHVKAKGDTDQVMYGAASAMNQKMHQLISAHVLN